MNKMKPLNETKLQIESRSVNEAFARSAVAAFAQTQTSRPAPPTQHTGSYKIMNGKVYYNNTILHEADPRTLLDMGYGFAKDNENVWYEGKLLPLVDPHRFRLKNDAPVVVPPPPHPAPAPQGEPGKRRPSGADRGGAFERRRGDRL